MKILCRFYVMAVFILSGAVAWADEALQPENASLNRTTFTLGPVHVKGKYPSMTGPIMKNLVTLNESATNGFSWVKSFRVDIVDDQDQPVSLEYLCHSWLTLGKDHRRLLTISQGLDEMTLPAGFAIVVKNVALNAEILVQALNNNEEIDKNLFYKLTVAYLTDDVAEKFGIRPLKMIDLGVKRENKKHFNVPPGRHEYHTLLERTDVDAGPLYRGGTIHYIKLHLHPYGESVSLIDKTAGQTLWTGKAVNSMDRAALESVDEFSSAEGIRIFPDHNYEVVGVYNNTTQKVIDAMALLRAYVSD